MNCPRHIGAFLLDVARITIRRQLGDDACCEPPAPDDALLSTPAGCFVSLHDLHTLALRGCVGRLDAHDPLLDAVRSAAASVLEDPRFVNDLVTLAQLPRLQIELSILSPLRAIPAAEDFDLQEDGIYIIHGNRHGCFLPQVARETGWTREQLLDRLCTEKLALDATAWRSADARFFAFTTLIIGPEPFVGPADPSDRIT